MQEGGKEEEQEGGGDAKRPANTMPGKAGDLCLSHPHVQLGMFVLGFGDTPDITTGANTHTDQPQAAGNKRKTHTLALSELLQGSLPGSAGMFQLTLIVP